MITVHTVKHEDLAWPFENRPSISIKGEPWGYGKSEEVDPFPCYQHDEGLVKECASSLQESFPLPANVHISILPYETKSRTNGYTDFEHNYRGEGEEREWAGLIVLQGKRIPLHPAMTRYLVPHEYGHVVEQFMRQRVRMLDGRSDFQKMYAELREDHHSLDGGYGGCKWHKNIGEVFANDFRILVANAEPEFWPHPCSRPEQSPKVVEYWNVAKQLAKSASSASDHTGEAA